MKADRGRPIPRWGGDYETMRLLGLEGEYLSFLLDIEVELGLLRHVLGCGECLGTVKERLSGEAWSDLGRVGRLFDDVKASNGVDLDDLIDGRLSRRIEQLEQLREDADLELGSLREDLKPLLRRDRG